MKTAWLWVADEYRGNKYWTGLDMAHRLLDIMEKIEAAFRYGYLPSRFNDTENILARIPGQEMKNQANFLCRMNNKWCNGGMRTFIQEVFEACEEQIV